MPGVSWGQNEITAELLVAGTMLLLQACSTERLR